MDEDKDYRNECQMNKCERSATGNFTRQMFSSEDGEDWPEDVSKRPICFYHHILLKSIKSGIAAAMFGLIVGLFAWFSGATNAAYLHLTGALIAGMILSESIRRIRKSQINI